MEQNWIYANTKDNKARFLLGEKGKKCLICIGINPSTANPDKLDNTLTTVRRFALALDYDSWLMLNVYPQRATNPNQLHTEMNVEYHKQNLKQMEAFLKTGKYDMWAAWGTLIRKRKYLRACLKDIVDLSSKYSANWYIMGKQSKSGHPHHPLYLSKDLKLKAFNVKEYMENLV